MFRKLLHHKGPASPALRHPAKIGAQILAIETLGELWAEHEFQFSPPISYFTSVAQSLVLFNIVHS